MPTQITVPRLGWSMEEGTFGDWLKAAGEPVRPGDLIYVLEGDKASQEMESLDSGILCIPVDAPKAGDLVKVGQVIGFLLAQGETPPATVGVNPPAAVVAADLSVPPAGAKQAAANSLNTSTASARNQSRIVATPRARRRARELNVDYAQLSGTGSGGRIRDRDVIAFASRPAHRTSSGAPPLVSGQYQGASRVRQTIAQRMLAAAQQTASVTLTTKVDATALAALRSQLQARFAGQIVPGYGDMIVKLVAEVLPECPQLNACWHRDGVFLFDVVNIALAVDTEHGLVAPVIENVTKLSLMEIAQRSAALIEQARQGTLSPRQLQGGTFTVSNLGMFDIDSFTPILNMPQAAILGVGRIVREPVVRGDAIVIGQTLVLSLTFDHRVIDGAPAARWLQRLARRIEQPAEAVG